MEIGLFFGSFNPVHVGHMILANHMVEHTNLRQVWMVLSPQNPLKAKGSLAKDHDRLYLLQLAVDDNPNLMASNIEFSLPKPSYTIDTLTYLQEKYPQKQFSLIMGADNISTIDKWKNYEILLANYKIYVYRRPGYELGKFAEYPNVTVIDAPLLDISATFIRDNLKHKRSIQYLVPDKVFEYLQNSKMYR
jgi:nicotinate-nucleotide adenylyltransferase